MRGLFIFLLLILVIISGCNIKVSNNPYIKEAYSDPPYIDLSSDSSKIVYTIINPSKIDFKGKIFPEFNKECFSYSQESYLVEVKSNSDKSGIMPIKKGYNLKSDCYKDQDIILRLSNEEGSLIYNSKTIKLKLIGN